MPAKFQESGICRGKGKERQKEKKGKEARNEVGKTGYVLIPS